LEELKKEEMSQIKAGVINEEKIKEILRKVDKSIGMDSGVGGV
jgi:hypothetical protein